MSTPEAADNSDKNTKRITLTRVLTTISHLSSPFIAVFLITHLSAPIIANVGGTKLASRTMLLGREYYQTKFGEPYLVLGPIAIHGLAGITKRLYVSLSSFCCPHTAKKPQQDTDSTSNPTSFHQRPFKSLLSLTAYSTAFLFLPIHYLTHRDYPTLDINPIQAVGPSFLDYEYVKFGLQTWPWRSWFLYLGLAGCVVLHAVEGAPIVWRTWLADFFKKLFEKKKSDEPIDYTRGGGLKVVPGSWGSSRGRIRRLVIASILFPLFAGMTAIADEPLALISSIAIRYKAAFMQSFVFRV